METVLRGNGPKHERVASDSLLVGTATPGEVELCAATANADRDLTSLVQQPAGLGVYNAKVMTG